MTANTMGMRTSCPIESAATTAATLTIVSRDVSVVASVGATAGAGRSTLPSTNGGSGSLTPRQCASLPPCDS